MINTYIHIYICVYIYLLIIEVSKKSNLNLWCPRSYTHSIYIVLSIISNIGMTYIIEKDMHRFYYTILYSTILYYTILYKGLEHPWILVSLGVLETISPWITRNNCVCVCVFSHFQLFVTPWTVACQRLLCPWDFPSKNTGVGCHFLLHGSSRLRDQPCLSGVSCIVPEFFTTEPLGKSNKGRLYLHKCVLRGYNI